MELEELLAVDTSEDGQVFGTQALNDTNKSRKSKSKKIQYTKRSDDSKDSNDDANSKKSARSRRSRVSRTANRVRKKSIDDTDRKEETRSESPKPSKSPRPDRNSKTSRKIAYKSKEPETPEERDRDARSHRSKDSKASRSVRRSSHRLTKNEDERDGVPSTRRGSNKGIKPSTSGRRSSSFDEKASQRKSWSFDDFDSNQWSSSEDEGDVDVGLNDEGLEGEFRLKDGDDENRHSSSYRSTGSGGERRSRPRRLNSRESTSVERQKAPQSNVTRSSSTGGVESRGSLSSKRHSRKGSGSAMDVGMILGDPSRRAPPTRSKSNDMANSRLKTGGGDRKSLPTRKNSGNFAEYLRQQGLTHKSDRSTSRTQYSDPSSLDSNEQDDNDNPFEVTYHASFAASDNWDPFGTEGTTEEQADGKMERRGNLRPTRSGGLLQTSSKDTISRLRVGANVRKVPSNSNLAAVPQVGGNTNDSGDREKQRRADYKKSIAAAAMVGRRLSNNGRKPTQRQARTVRSSFEESFGQLEGALQSAQ